MPSRLKNTLRCAALLTLAAPLHAAEYGTRFVEVGAGGRFEYASDARGNRLPDFSYAGYGGGGVALPEAIVRVKVAPASGDDGARLQAAIDYVSQLPLDEKGLRGAVLLAPGRYEVAGQIFIRASGVVLRGSGQSTAIVATGTSRRTLIEIKGAPDKRLLGAARNVVDEYLPVNARTLEVDAAEGLKVGDAVLISRPSPKNWVEFAGQGAVAGRPAPLWKAGTVNITWERRIEAINGTRVTLDVPLTCALEKQFGGATLSAYEWPGRVRNVGVENLLCESAWNKKNPRDEEHAWLAVSLENAEDAWVRNLTARHFVSSAVQVLQSCRRVTVQDCASQAPVSEIAGYRRHSFYTNGGQTLFLRCRAEEGRHDFAVGWLAPGPNAFVECTARGAHDFSGPIESWATGVLFDNVSIDGGDLRLDNRELWDNGVGWAAANSLLWQCSAPVILARTPPGAQNWVAGCWGQLVGDAQWRSPHEFIKPDSFYKAQLTERGGDVKVLDARTVSLEAAGALSLEEVLRRVPPAPVAARQKHALQIVNGWLTVDGKLLIGRQRGVNWWRGHAQPGRAEEFGESITRFVPGRSGAGVTDDLPTLADSMANKGQAALRHHYGLWYDRRRDDHQMMRRRDADVWPPFYEQPFARTGQGQSWNGLSLYDLTKFNPWYFGRLREFAGLCDERGLLLVHAMYFQHNIIESGAHWVDCPWRNVNNLNGTGFKEPPPFDGDTIKMADEFYDVSHATRRKLHQGYIRQCLNNFSAENNVLHVIGEEFTGPLPFMRFWVDEVASWRKSTRGQAFIALSAPKDVQDAILNDPKRAAQIDAIDFKYWWQTGSGLFAPPGGRSLAPRQEERKWKGGRPNDGNLAQMAAEYRTKYPGKAVLCAFDAAGWAFLCAGGSLANLPSTTDARLLRAIPQMLPWRAGTAGKQWTLRAAGTGYLVHAPGGEATLNLTDEKGAFAVHEVNTATGEVKARGERVSGGETVILKGATTFWLSKEN